MTMRLPRWPTVELKLSQKLATSFPNAHNEMYLVPRIYNM